MSLWSDASFALFDTGWATALRESIWAFPIVQLVHIAGVALLVGPILVVDRRHVTVTAPAPPGLMGRALPLAWAGFVLAAASGVALFGAQADKIHAVIWLQAKLWLILLAGANMAWFHWRQRRGLPLRLPALLSILLWSAILVMARLIAYAV